jgi:enoyl-CoA hydratase
VTAGGICEFARRGDPRSAATADFVAAARQSLADPDWFEKIRPAAATRVRRCEFTNYCEALDQQHKQVTCQLWDRDIARITLNRPDRGNGLTLVTPRELAECVELANLDPAVHVIALAGQRQGVLRRLRSGRLGRARHDGADGRAGTGPARSPLDPVVQRDNHDPSNTWDPMVDYQMMSRNVRGFMSLFHSDKPVVCKVHGFCVAGGTDLALCSDLLVIEDTAKIGYPPARVWGVPTTAIWAHRIGIEKAKRLLFTGDCLSGTEAVAWGLATEVRAGRSQLDERFEILLSAHREACRPTSS